MPGYMIAAYAIFWVLAFAFMLRMWAKQRHLEREIDALRELLRQRE